MGKQFWILMGVLGAALILLVLNHDSGVVMGIPTGAFASVIALSCWAVFIAGGAFSLQSNWASTLGQIAIWLVIILALMTGYVVYNLYIAPEKPSIVKPVREASIKCLQPAHEYAISPSAEPKKFA